MSDWGYVILGWSVTGGAIGIYWSWIAARTRRAARDAARLEDPA